MSKKQSGMSKWWILVFAVIIFAGMNIYDYYTEEKLPGLSGQIAELNKPLYPQPSQVLAPLFIGVILFYLIQFIKRIYD